ncbi:MAG: hypothetical protein KDK37_05940, partial [Leptospiraceae bacterium]|nr:hypothetical protein [Leptospiraceae bacterium]
MSHLAGTLGRDDLRALRVTNTVQLLMFGLLLLLMPQVLLVEEERTHLFSMLLAAEFFALLIVGRALL